jgi:hypothetical protein
MPICDPVMMPGDMTARRTTRRAPAGGRVPRAPPQSGAADTHLRDFRARPLHSRAFRCITAL